MHDRSFDVSVLNCNHIMYIAISHRSFPSRTVFAFLHAAAEEFISIYGYEHPE